MQKRSISVKSNDNQILKELIRNQRSDVDEDKKLYLQDIQRICKNVSSSPFHKTECCVWEGYITNLNKANKGTYINFYFRHKKVALHRLMYANYVGDIHHTDYLKYTCNNKGLCCNINHLQKFKYNKGNGNGKGKGKGKGKGNGKGDDGDDGEDLGNGYDGHDQNEKNDTKKKKIGLKIIKRDENSGSQNCKELCVEFN